MHPLQAFSLRCSSWIFGALLGAALVASLPQRSSSAEHLAAFLAPILLSIIASECILLLLRASPAKLVPIRWTELADGATGIAEVPGVAVSESGEYGEFSRFEAFSRDNPVIDTPPRNSRPPLLGRVVLASVFVGRDGRRWQPDEIRSSLNEVARAARWIARQAATHAVPLHIDLARVFLEAEDTEPAGSQEFGFGYQGDELVPSTPRQVVSELSSMSRAAGQLGFRDAADLVDSIGRRIEADAIAWILCPMRSGLSFAVRESDGHLPGVNLAVCYPRYSDFSGRLKGAVGTDPATVAHEILHLFGAEDKYGLPLDDGPSPGVTSRDVMRLDSPRLSQLRIDPLTASEIGWGRR
ncbi:hypothetical protein EP7_003650 [Isosphaeraceae bacterium EP7]